MREDSDVDTFRRANKAEHWITEDTVPPRVAGAVPDENLRNAFLTRKVHYRRYGIIAFQHFGRRTGLFGRIEIFSNGDSFSFGAAGLANVHCVEFTLKTLFVAFSAFNHSRSIGMRCHADEKTLVRPEDGLNSVRMHVGLQLRVYHFGSQQQGEFAKF